MIPKEMTEAFLNAWDDYNQRPGRLTHEERVEFALTAALSSARKNDLVLCSMTGGIHEGTCPTCGCQPLPSPPEEKAASGIE